MKKKLFSQGTFITTLLALGLAALVSGGCTKNDPPPDQQKSTVPGTQTQTPTNTNVDPSTFPVFVVVVSEYPSWIAFIYAQNLGLIDLARGKVGRLEFKWQVDIELKLIDYDPCISSFASGQADAAALTNIDTLQISEGIKTVAIFPTSTSDRADAILTNDPNINTLADLKGVTVWGLENTVSHYNFDRVLEKAGLNPADFTYKMKDPMVCATEMQQNNPETKAISVWNPFKIQTLTARKNVRVLGDSGVIPLEILDLMVASQASLDREGGDRFAACLAEIYYVICARIDDPNTREETLLGMIDKFAPLTLAQMETVVRETRFFNTPQKALALYGNPQMHEAMKTVQNWTDRKGITTSRLKVGYGTKQEAPNATFRYDPTYILLMLRSQDK